MIVGFSGAEFFGEVAEVRVFFRRIISEK